MKQYLSPLMLVVRHSIYKVLWIFGIMILGETAFFLISGIHSHHLYHALNEIPAEVFLYGAIVLLAIILSHALCDRGGKMNNTILRLGISEQALYWLQAIYNTLVFALLFMLQGLLFVLFSLLYGAANPEGYNVQSILVTSYQHWTFHVVFPQDNVLCLITGLMISIGLGICTAAYPMRQRHGMRSITTAVMLVLALLCTFMQEEGGHLDISVSLVYGLIPCLLCIGSSLCGVLTMEVDDHG